MAILFGPLHSDDARGKLASSLVFMGWKGIKTVRAYVRPANPKSEGQGNIRLIIGGTGRAAAQVDVGSEYAAQLATLELIPDQQSKQSWIVQQIKDLFFAGSGATLTASYIAQLAEFTGATAYTSWRTVADEFGVAEFSLSYDGLDAYDKGLGMFLLAKLAVANGFTGAPYTLTVTSWTATGIALFTADLLA